MKWSRMADDLEGWGRARDRASDGLKRYIVMLPKGQETLKGFPEGSVLRVDQDHAVVQLYLSTAEQLRSADPSLVMEEDHQHRP